MKGLNWNYQKVNLYSLEQIEWTKSRQLNLYNLSIVTPFTHQIAHLSFCTTLQILSINLICRKITNYMIVNVLQYFPNLLTFEISCSYEESWTDIINKSCPKLQKLKVNTWNYTQTISLRNLLLKLTNLNELLIHGLLFDFDENNDQSIVFPNINILYLPYEFDTLQLIQLFPNLEVFIGLSDNRLSELLKSYNTITIDDNIHTNINHESNHDDNSANDNNSNSNNIIKKQSFQSLKYLKINSKTLNSYEILNSLFYFPALQHIITYDIKTNNEIILLCKYCNNLVNIDLGNGITEISNNGIINGLIKYCNNILYLNLGSDNLIDDNDIIIIMKMYPNLLLMTLRSKYITNNSILLLINNCLQLNLIVLSNCDNNITLNTIITICNIMNKRCNNGSILLNLIKYNDNNEYLQLFSKFQRIKIKICNYLPFDQDINSCFK